MRALTVAAAALGAGLALGAAAHGLHAPPSARAAAALFSEFGLMACAAAAMGAAAPASVARGGLAFGAAFVGSFAAASVAGEPAVVGACAAVAGASALAFGVAAAFRSGGAGAGHAAFAGAALPAALAAIVFVADPFVEWQVTDAAPGRAAAVIAVNPLTSIAADAGVDWQRTKWMYDGPAPGSSGLSVIGQYYPSRTTSPWLWATVAVAAGFAAMATGAGLRRRGALGSPPC